MIEVGTNCAQARFLKFGVFKDKYFQVQKNRANTQIIYEILK